MSLNLQHIPCPAGNKCTAFKCIFGHDHHQPETTATEVSIPKTRDPSLGDGDLEGPRKRVRLDREPTADAPSGSDSAALKGESRRPQQSATPKLQTAAKPISPPPLRRAAAKPDQASPSAKVSSASASSASSSKLSGPSASGTPPKPTTAQKPEYLNPRLLRKAPAAHDIRLKLLKLLHTEYARLNSELKKDASDDESKLVLSDQGLIKRALDEEQKVAITKSAVYSNVMKNRVLHYRRMSTADWKKEREKEAPAGSKRARETTDGPKKLHTDLTPAEEVKLLKEFITPVEGLAAHGYVSSVPSEESIKKAKEGQEAGQGWEKCDRCQQRFQVFPGRREGDGALTSGGTCTFHWGKPYVPTKAPGDTKWRTKRYQCCGEDVGDSTGCYSRDHHVFKVSNGETLASILNYAETPENPSVPADRAVSFDCEMGYTVYGLELIRLTVVSWPLGEALLDVLVRPQGEILDLNSRYSGVWPEDLARAKPWPIAPDSEAVKEQPESGSEDGEVLKKALPIVSSPEAAREIFFSLISPTTPLIGHGLENDLNAVRIIHPTIIDTVLLYPHRAGLPYRHGLKTLMSTHLNVKIQQETGPKVTGHDSAEDAKAAGDLVRLKVVEEYKKRLLTGWKVENGQLVASS